MPYKPREIFTYNPPATDFGNVLFFIANKVHIFLKNNSTLFT